MKTRIGLMAAAATLAWSTASLSATEIQFWHAMGGALGEKVDEIAGKYNASQSDYVVKPVFKGNYTETLDFQTYKCSHNTYRPNHFLLHPLHCLSLDLK